MPAELAVVMLACLAVALARATIFAGSLGAKSFSEPLVVQSYASNNKRHYLDDLREGFSWLRENTAEDAVVLSWWDHGYQLAGMANRSTVVDNNTWNHTHIGKIGMVGPDD